MARRRIGQERLAVGNGEVGKGSSLDEVAALIDWAELDALLAGISAAAKGEPGWPPLALFRALLLATWHDLSDVRLAGALDDRASPNTVHFAIRMAALKSTHVVGCGVRGRSG